MVFLFSVCALGSKEKFIASLTGKRDLTLKRLLSGNWQCRVHVELANPNTPNGDI